MIPQSLSPQDLYALSRAFTGLTTHDLKVENPLVAGLLRSVDWKNPQQVGMAKEMVKGFLADILALNPISPYEPPLTVVQGNPQDKSHLILADELKNLSPPRYALNRYPIYASSLNALVGPSGAGKSFVAVDISGMMAMEGAKVVYIAGEGLFGYSSRWEVWKAHNGITHSPNLIFYDRAVNFIDPLDMEKFFTEIAAHKPDMVVVDTVARCMGGADENSTKDMNGFVAACDRITHTFGAGVLVVHHTGKDGKMRGSSALFGACDSVIFLQRDENQIRLYNSLDFGGKNKHGQEVAPKYLTLIPKITAHDGKAYESAVLVESERVIRGETEQLKPREKMILEAVEGHDSGLSHQAIISSTGIPQSSIYRLLGSLKKQGYLQESEDKYLITENGRNALSDY